LELFNRALPGISGGTLERWGEMFRNLNAVGEKNIQEPHWSLSPIFILPEFQGKGIGSALIRKQLTLIDAGGFPITLTAQEAKNVAIYRGYGFAVAAQEEIGNSGITSWAMARPGKPYPARVLD
jgi:GNAT superfamily N-acetyltransferase